MNFEYYLYQYLLKHHKAEVPDFGVFELTKESAKIDSESSIITPPKEVVAFRYQPTVFDNHLAKYVAEETQSNLFTTQMSLKSEVSNWIQKLQGGNILSLGNLGQFQFDENKNIVKIADNNEDVFGLEAINMESLKLTKSKVKILTEDYSFNKNVLWTFLALIVVGTSALFLFGDTELIFGKSSKIPTKKTTVKPKPSPTVIIPKQDSIKIDSIKPIKNANIQKINR
ncbi:hypothetical protein D3C87_397800 [compost metagenome]